MPPSISVVITDLDNTLFDWVEVWYRSFSALLDELVTTTGLPREHLLDDARAIHQRQGTSEYYFLVAELRALPVGVLDISKIVQDIDPDTPIERGRMS